MASLGVHSWSTTAGNNVLANIGIALSGSDLVSVFDNSLRQILADLRAEFNVRSGAVASGGSSNAYTYDTTSAGYATAWSSYVHGDTIAFEANHTNDGAATLNVDSIGAKALRKGDNAALVSGDIVSGAIYAAVYDSGDDVFRLISPVAGAYSAGGTDVALADGGTGASLADPGADRIMFWDDSEGAVDWLTAGSHLAISTTTLSVSTGTSGDVIPLLSGANTWSGAQTFTSSGGLSIQAAVPTLIFDETDATTDERIWFLSPNNGQFRLLTRTDAGGAGATPLLIDRSGTTVTEFEVNATLIDLNGVVECNSIELGDGQTDTTLTRVSAGVAAIEGVNIVTVSATQTLTNKTLTSPTLTTPTINGGTIQSRVQTSSETSGTLTSASANKRIDMSGNITIDDGVFSEGDVLLLESNGSARTITQAAGMTLILGGTATTGSRSMSANCVATVVFRSASVATVSGLGVT